MHKIKEHIENIIKACIHCGICLPACPTYQVTGNEGHSPRGRIYQINDLIRGESQPQDQERIKYLDGCLSCLGCQTVCPSDVQYQNIIEFARDELQECNYDKGPFGLIRKLAFKYLLPNRNLLNFGRVAYKITNAIIPIHKLLKPSPRFEHKYKAIKTNFIYKSSVDIILSERSEREDPDYQKISERPTVTLPLGCVMDTVYNDVHWDTIKVLNAFGYDVYIPESNCCGALAYHSHEEKIGLEQLHETEKILETKNYPIISNSAGCGAFMKGHSELKVMDLVEALNCAPLKAEDVILSPQSGRKDPEPPKFYSKLDHHVANAPHDDVAVYHPACHLNHLQGIAYDYLHYLKLIPGLELKELYEADLCCGSAGFYNLIESEMAEAIGKRKAENIKNTQAKLVITANPGCMSQIQTYLGNEYQVVHPVTVLAIFLDSQALT